MSSPGEPAQPSGSGGEADILRERDRIAAELRNDVIQQVFAVGLNLQGTATMVSDPLVRRRVDQAVEDLDRVVKMIRDAVFHRSVRRQGGGLRAGIVRLCEQLSPVPDVTFHGPVDGALHPTASAELLDILDDAFTVIRKGWALAAVDITAADGVHLTTVRAIPLPDGPGAGEADHEFPGLRERAAEAGMRIDIEPGPELVQIRWHAA